MEGWDPARLEAELLAERIIAEEAAGPRAMTDEQGRSMVNTAWHCARTSCAKVSWMSVRDMFEAALTGIAEYVYDYGWPAEGEDDRPVFRAGANAIQREARATDPKKPLRFGSYFYQPGGREDRVGEDVAERVGIHQACHALTEGQWAAVWALAEVMKTGGGMAEAADLLGLEYYTFAMRLQHARRRVRELWVAPGETPRGHYRPNSRERSTALRKWQRDKRIYQGRLRRQEEAS